MNSVNHRRKENSKGTRYIYYLVLFSTAITLIYCSIVVIEGSRSYKQAIENGREDAKRLTRILADQADLSFLGTNVALRRAVDRQHLNSLFGNNLPEYMEQNFRAWLSETPQVAALALIDHTGKVQVAVHRKKYEKWLDYSKNLIGDRLFDYMREETNDDYAFIGRHIGSDGTPLIVLSRRYTQTNGEFGGIVIAAVNPEYFSNFYGSVAPGKTKYMSLTLAGNVILAEGPAVSRMDAQAITQLQNHLQSNAQETAVETIHTKDGLQVIATKRLRNMRVYVNVVLNEDDLLMNWQISRSRDLSFLGLFLVLSIGLSLFSLTMARQIARAEASEEAAILASQAKSDFLANMSHELRTPLNAIIGFSEMMSSGYFGALTPKQRERVHDINLCGTHLLQLISDILEFSKGNAGKLELIEERMNIEEIIRECERIMSAKLKLKNLQFITTSEPELPLFYGDRRKIRQILLNLIANSIKFTPEGGTIRITAMQDAYRNLNLIVTDTGIGIAEEEIPKALSVFGQVHRARSGEGTGLGLPLCKMYAELHGGKLLLTSKLGEGTNVRIIFPASRMMGASR